MMLKPIQKSKLLSILLPESNNNNNNNNNNKVYLYTAPKNKK